MKLDKTSIEWAIRSLDRHGDTDLFPRAIELRTLISDVAKAVDKIGTIDISNHQASAPRRFIVPKDDLSYRAATQLDPLDSVILTALVHQLGQLIEVWRRPVSELSVFSYRFAPSTDGNLYQSKNAWNQYWLHCYELSKNAEFALILDISDFYNQIYHHTVENQLVSSGWPNPAVKWCLRLFETVSAKVSRGIPVGPHAAHLLAEASLIPVDNSLSARGVTFCRFVDDIVVFADDKLMARTHLYQIAEILDKQQRLQLQGTKTKVLPKKDFQRYCHEMIEDRPVNDLESQILALIKKYSEDNPYRAIYLSEISDDDLKAFHPSAIEKILSDYVESGTPNFVRLRWFLRRLSQIGHPAALRYCLSNFDRMTPAVSDLCRYFVSVAASGVTINWIGMGSDLLRLLDSDLIRSNEYLQMSVLSLFNRDSKFDHIPERVCAILR